MVLWLPCSCLHRKRENTLGRCFGVSPLVIFAIFCAKCFLVFPVLGGFWALGPSRLTPWHEEESFSQKIAKITKTIPRWKADARSHLFISEVVEAHQRGSCKGQVKEWRL